MHSYMELIFSKVSANMIAVNWCSKFHRKLTYENATCKGLTVWDPLVAPHILRILQPSVSDLLDDTNKFQDKIKLDHDLRLLL